MGQGFQLQVNNGTSNPLVLEALTVSNFEASNNISSLASADSSGLLYYEVANGDVGILQIGFAQLKGPAGVQGNVYLHFDSRSTNEFNGSIYIAGFTRVPAGPQNVFLYPYLILNQINASQNWPFGNLTFVTVIGPTLPEYPFPPS